MGSCRQELGAFPWVSAVDNPDLPCIDHPAFKTRAPCRYAGAWPESACCSAIHWAQNEPWIRFALSIPWVAYQRLIQMNEARCDFANCARRWPIAIKSQNVTNQNFRNWKADISPDRLHRRNASKVIFLQHSIRLRSGAAGIRIPSHSQSQQKKDSWAGIYEADLESPPQ
jgi:hypothetical protein